MCACKLFFFFQSLIIIKSQILTKDEKDIALVLIKHFEVHHTILVLKNDANLATVKNVIQNECLTAFMRIENLGNVRYRKLLKTMIIAEMDDANDFRNLKQVTRRTMSDNIWVIFKSSVNEVIGSDVYIPFDCKFIVVESRKKNIYSMKVLHQVKENTTVYVEEYGVWSKAKGLEVDDRILQVSRNLMGFPLKILTHNKAMCMNELECRHREIWEEYSQVLNFTTVGVPAGLGNTTVHYDATIEVRSFHHFAIRHQPIGPIIITKAYMHIRYGTDTTEEFYSYIKPFDYDLWIASLFWLLVSTGVSAVIELSSGVLSVSRSLTVDYIFRSFEILCNQNGACVGDDAPSRISFLVDLLTSSIIVPAYCATITSFLTVKFPHIPFRSIEEFNKDGTYTIGSIYGSFRPENEPTLAIINEKLIVPYKEMPMGHSKAAKKICKERFTFIGYNNLVEGHLTREDCQIIQIHPQIFKRQTAIALESESTFRKTFHLRLTNFYEAGIINKLNKDLESKHQIMGPSETDDFDIIAFERVLPLLMIFGAAASVSLVIVTAELLWWKRRNGSSVMFPFRI